MPLQTNDHGNCCQDKINENCAGMNRKYMYGLRHILQWVSFKAGRSVTEDVYWFHPVDES